MNTETVKGVSIGKGQGKDPDTDTVHADRKASVMYWQKFKYKSLLASSLSNINWRFMGNRNGAGKGEHAPRQVQVPVNRVQVSEAPK